MDTSFLFNVASPETILSWSRGEVLSPETINYRTQRAEKDGLFDERIFGPEKDYECFCGKYRKIRYKGITCDKCGVEITKSIVRRERMGHIALAVPVSHIWFLRSVPSTLSVLLNVSGLNLEKVAYFSGYIIIKVNEEAKKQSLGELEKQYKERMKLAKTKEEKNILKENYDLSKEEIEKITEKEVLSEATHYALSARYGHAFESGTGAETLYELAKKINLAKLKDELTEELKNAKGQEAIKITKRLGLVKAMHKAGVKPEWLFLKILPVIPPDLRPIVQLEGGRQASSDINDLYRRVINRNNRLKRLLEINAPQVIIRNEKRMLQEAVDTLIDNSMRRGQAAAMSKSQKRPLKSLADLLRGKQGRFRQNLLGKRVDYSARSVIVVGPELELDRCGLPKHMCLELFRPFIISRLLKEELSHNVRGANRLIDEGTPEVWRILEEIINEKYVLLNRAPTLHRLGIQAFRPILIEGNAIQLHPLVCQGYNADFDGDQMAVHLPITEEAQREAAEYMASVKNLLKPGTGEPIVNPQQDIVLGCFWLTRIKDGAKGEGKYFENPSAAIAFYQQDGLELRAKIKVRISEKIVETTVGRLIFNEIFPENFEFINGEVKKKDLAKIVAKIISHYGAETAKNVLDSVKTLGFKYATLSGISFAMDDLKTPAQKQNILNEAEKEAEKILDFYAKGLLSEHERYDSLVRIWQAAAQKINQLVPSSLEQFGSIFSMVSSAARGNWAQVNQLGGMRGLVVNPAGKIIELPVKSNFREGLKVLEYFISTHGARKGIADTALKTSAAGHLTRRLVDMAQSVIILEDDCKDANGFIVNRKEVEDYGRKFGARIFGRTLAKDLNDKKGNIIFKKGRLLSIEDAELVESQGIEEITIRSPLTCKTRRGLCRTCYGYDLGKNKLVELGEAVGVVAAQAIGEPGTQLTMRTFHYGGVLSKEDITLGLPQIEELFEARSPSNPAVISETEGRVVEIAEENREKIIKIETPSGEMKEYIIPFGRVLEVKTGKRVEAGDRLSDGIINVKRLFELRNEEAAKRYILNEIERVYLSQNAPTNEKHIEIIIRQMFSRVKITNEGETDFSVESIVEKADFDEENEKAKKAGKKPAKGEPLLLGITKTALTAASFLSAASFQETTRILISAALEGKKDNLLGLKENVIMGRLIPAGTNFRKEYKKEALKEEIKEKERKEARIIA